MPDIGGCVPGGGSSESAKRHALVLPLPAKVAKERLGKKQNAEKNESKFSLCDNEELLVQELCSVKCAPPRRAKRVVNAMITKTRQRRLRKKIGDAT